MKNRLIPCMTGLLLLSVNLASAQDRDNAALWFQRAIDAYGEISEADRELVNEYARNLNGPPSPAVQDVLRRSGQVFNFIRRAGDQEYNDFNLDYSQGFELILPHLQPLRDMGRLMMADAMMQLENGDTRLAAERLAAIYRMSSHVGDDRILISSLVGQMIFNGSDQVVQMALDKAMFDSADSAILLRSLQRLPGDDPFNYLQSVLGEQAISIEWMDLKFGDQAERIRMAEQMEWMTNSEEDAQRLAAMSDEDFTRDLQTYDRAMDQVVEVFATGDLDAGRAMLEQLETEVQNGDHGFLAQILMPSLLRVYESKAKARETIDQRIDVLSGLVTGEIEPEQEANAALYYLRGVELIDKMDPSQQAMLRRHFETPGTVIDDEFRVLLDGAVEVIDLFREGSHKRRCDFENYRKRDDSALLPFYAAGMHDVFRLLAVDALRLIRAGAYDQAADRLAISYRVIGHLSSDDPLIIPLIAHDAFSRSEMLAKELMTREAFSDIHQLQLFDAIDMIPRKDPFGYIGSVVAVRKTIAGEIIRRSPAIDRADRTRVEATTRSWNGDHLFYLKAIFDTMKRSDEDDAMARARELKTLDDLLLTPKLELARDEVPIVAPLIVRGRLDFFEERSIPVFAAYISHSRTARADLRAGLFRLRPRVEQ